MERRNRYVGKIHKCKPTQPWPGIFVWDFNKPYMKKTERKNYHVKGEHCWNFEIQNIQWYIRWTFILSQVLQVKWSNTLLLPWTQKFKSFKYHVWKMRHNKYYRSSKMINCLGKILTFRCLPEHMNYRPASLK